MVWDWAASDRIRQAGASARAADARLHCAQDAVCFLVAIEP